MGGAEILGPGSPLSQGSDRGFVSASAPGYLQHRRRSDGSDQLSLAQTGRKIAATQIS